MAQLTKEQKRRAAKFREQRIAYAREVEERRLAGIANGTIKLPEPLPQETIDALRSDNRRLADAIFRK